MTLKKSKLTSKELTNDVVVECTNKPFKNKNEVFLKRGASQAENFEIGYEYLNKFIIQ